MKKNSVQQNTTEQPSMIMKTYRIQVGESTSLGRLRQFQDFIAQQKEAIWLDLHPDRITKQCIRQFERGRRWLDGLLRQSCRNLNRLRIQSSPIKVSEQSKIRTLTSLQNIYYQFPTIAKPYVYEYDPNTLELMRKENISTTHYKNGFEPCYDWGGITGKPIPSWAQKYTNIELNQREQSEENTTTNVVGKIPKTQLPSEVIDQGIEYCVYFYKENKLIVRTYRKIGFKPSKYFCQYCLYKLDDSQIVNRVLLCPKCGNILIPPGRIDAIIQKQITDLTLKTKEHAQRQEKLNKSKRQLWLDQEWQSYYTLFQGQPLLEKLTQEFVKADYIVNPEQYDRAPFDDKTSDQFSLKGALFRMIALRKPLFKFLSNQEIMMYRKQVKRDQAQNLDTTDVLFSEILEQFAASSFSFSQLLYFLLLSSNSSISITHDPQDKSKTHTLEITLDLQSLYRIFFEVMVLRFKKAFKLNTTFQFIADDYLPFFLEEKIPETDTSADLEKDAYDQYAKNGESEKETMGSFHHKISSAERFLSNINQYLHSFNTKLFQIRKAEPMFECKLDVKGLFQEVWNHFQNKYPLNAQESLKSKDITKLSEKQKIRLKKIIIISSIIAFVIVGFFLGSFWFNNFKVVKKGDSVKLDYTVWVSDDFQFHDPFNPVLEGIVIVNMVPITEDGENGLILGLYNNLLDKRIGYESRLIWLNKCIDQDRNGIDDMTGYPALSYGNNSDLYFNICLLLQFRVIEIVKPQTAPQLDPLVITGIFIVIGLIWLGGYIGIHLVKRIPKT